MDAGFEKMSAEEYRSMLIRRLRNARYDEMTDAELSACDDAVQAANHRRRTKMITDYIKERKIRAERPA